MLGILNKMGYLAALRAVTFCLSVDLQRLPNILSRKAGCGEVRKICCLLLNKPLVIHVNSIERKKERKEGKEGKEEKKDVWMDS